MEILIVGAGVIGTIYGSILADAGHAVTHYVRPGKKKTLENGISVRLLDGRSKKPTERSFTYNLKLTEELSAAHHYDLFIVSVRHYHIASVLPIIKDHIGQADLLFFNGIWKGLDEINQYISPSKYLWGFPVAGGGFDGQDLNGAVLGEIHLGELTGESTARLQRIRNVFEQAHIKVDVQSNMLHWLWVHFAINCGVIGAAFKAGGAKQLLSSIGNLRKAILAGRDALSVCRARGVDVSAFDDAKSFSLPPVLGAFAVWMMMKTNLPARRIFEKHTAVDELQKMYIDVLTTGNDLNVPMPEYMSLRPYVDNPHLH